MPGGIRAETAVPQRDWRWLAEYLGAEEDLGAVLASFPPDEPMRAAVSGCRGLRLLRQEPWECLASFVLSSTKQIVQIRRMVELLSERLGEPVAVPAGHPPAYAFPEAARLAGVGETELRACGLGFRARYLRAVAARIARAEPELESLRERSLEAAREGLLALPGVGPKIANCVLLFALGFERAFPLDVWVLRALRQLYFPGRRVTFRRLQRFSETYFGPRGGYAQQYLFHHMRQRAGRGPGAAPIPPGIVEP
jgi:N-glycosylase/DNA lyase